MAVPDSILKAFRIVKYIRIGYGVCFFLEVLCANFQYSDVNCLQILLLYQLYLTFRQSDVVLNSLSIFAINS